MLSDLEHIEDTNDAENYSLTTITDENIINQDMGNMGVKNPKVCSQATLLNLILINSQVYTWFFMIIF